MNDFILYRPKNLPTSSTVDRSSVSVSETPTSAFSVPVETTNRLRLVIVGGGMAAYGLVRQIERGGGLAAMDVRIIGDEPHRAYDRVNLSKSVDGNPSDLELASEGWYQRHHVEFDCGRRVVSIDRENRCLIDSDGEEVVYDRLVLATGSSPFVPPVPGADGPGILVYRTIDDLQAIRRRCRDEGVGRGAVIGGGLLGLEAAKIMRDAGMKVCIMERAAGLMPRQLDDSAARLLKRRVEEMGVEVRTVCRLSSIETIESEPSGVQNGVQTDGQTSTAADAVRHDDRHDDKDHQVASSNAKSNAKSITKTRIHFENGPPLTVDVLIIAAGVKPNDQLAIDAGLAIGARGGVAVDATMATSDPHIDAIGECVSFDDQLFGLVAPCYRMADVLASRLCGGDDRFDGGDSSAELKLLGVTVATLGQTLDEVPGAMVLRFDGEDSYRRLILDRGRLVGATCVGSWDQLAQVRVAVERGKTLWPWQRTRFRSTGSPWPGEALPVRFWPAEALICACHRVSRGEITNAVDAFRAAGDGVSANGVAVDGVAIGGTRFDEDVIDHVRQTTSASTACGTCADLVCELAGSPARADLSATAKVVSVASLVGAALVVVVLVLPPIELAASVQSSWRKIDVLWRSEFARQVTGYTTLGLTSFGLILSLRKRFPGFVFGSHAFWRAVHSAIGATVIVTMAIHTGLHMGQNLNFVLSSMFLGTAAVGTTIGIASAAERRSVGGMSMLIRRLRPKLTTLHNILFWPLPALVLVHILSFYWFSS